MHVAIHVIAVFFENCPQKKGVSPALKNIKIITCVLFLLQKMFTMLLKIYLWGRGSSERFLGNVGLLMCKPHSSVHSKKRSKVKSRSQHDVAHLHPLTNVPTKYQLPTCYGFRDIARTRFYRSRSLWQGQIKVRP